MLWIDRISNRDKRGDLRGQKRRLEAGRAVLVYRPNKIKLQKRAKSRGRVEPYRLYPRL